MYTCTYLTLQNNSYACHRLHLTLQKKIPTHPIAGDLPGLPVRANQTSVRLPVGGGWHYGAEDLRAAGDQGRLVGARGRGPHGMRVSTRVNRTTPFLCVCICVCVMVLFRAHVNRNACMRM